MKCSDCGQEIGDEKFCSFCGAYQRNTKTLTTSNSNVTNTNHATRTYSSNNLRTTAAILAFYLGTLGIHNFYLKNMAIGFIQLILGMLWIILWIYGTFLSTNPRMVFIFRDLFLVISGNWAIIDFIRIVCGSMKDGNGKTI